MKMQGQVARNYHIPYQNLILENVDTSDRFQVPIFGIPISN